MRVVWYTVVVVTWAQVEEGEEEHSDQVSAQIWGFVLWEPVVLFVDIRGHEFMSIRVHGARDEKIRMTKTVCRTIVLFESLQSDTPWSRDIQTSNK